MRPNRGLALSRHLRFYNDDPHLPLEEHAATLQDLQQRGDGRRCHVGPHLQQAIRTRLTSGSHLYSLFGAEALRREDLQPERVRERESK